MKQPGKPLRQGYTTGTCAALAAKAAVKMLLGKEIIQKESIMTPKGVPVSVPIVDIKQQEDQVSCGVQKDAGDDPDVTNGIMVYACARKIAAAAKEKEEPQIMLTGGRGIGRVTKPGLAVPVGEAAINPVPRSMIRAQVKEIMEMFGYEGRIAIEISAPEGEVLAAKTFNPRLGIVGGISILGTSGIVEPMSEQALVDTIKVEINVLAANQVWDMMITPGNYGADFIRDTLHLELDRAVKCSNYIGETIDYAVEKGMHSILLVGHVGKLVKLAAGIMNTHSHQADGRMEIFTAYAALEGVPGEVLEQLISCVSTDEAIRILQEQNKLQPVMKRIMERIAFHLQQRCFQQIPVGAIMFSNVYGILGMTSQAEQLLELQKKRQTRKDQN